jgi:hypothetical protein
MLEVEWLEDGWKAQVERVVPVYNKTDVLGLQKFLRENFLFWASNSSCVEEIKYKSESNVLSHIKCLEKIRTLKNTTRKLSD